MKSKLFLFILLSVFSFKSLADVATAAAFAATAAAVAATVAVGSAATLASFPIIDKLDERKELRNELYNLHPIIKALIRNDVVFVMENINRNNVNDKIYGEFSLIHIVSLLGDSLIGNTTYMDHILRLGADPNQRVTLSTRSLLIEYSFTPIDLLKYNLAVIAPFPKYIGSKNRRKKLQKQTDKMIEILEKAGGIHTQEIEKLLEMPKVNHKLFKTLGGLLMHDVSYLTKKENYERLVIFSQSLPARDKLFLNSHLGDKPSFNSDLYKASPSKFKSKEKYATKVLDNEDRKQKKQEQKNNSRVNCKNTFSQLREA